MRKRKVLCVGASVAPIGAFTLKVADTPTRKKNIFHFFCCYPTLCVWGKHSAWRSAAEIVGDSPRTLYRAEARRRSRSHFVLRRKIYESKGD